jgi:hypothetical protein
MLGTRLLKSMLAGAVVLTLLTAGGSWLVTTVRGRGSDPAAHLRKIGQGTEIRVERWCLVCGDYRPVDVSPAWQGKDREQLESLLVRELPDARILAFSQEQVLVHLPPGYCEKCMAFLPQQGYISLTDGNQIAVFSHDGTLYKTFGEAPGAWIAELTEGIPFASPQDCLDWIVNLTS